MSAQTIVPYDRDAVSALSHSKHEPEWMLKQRLEALALSEKLELPKLEKTRIDRWKIDSYGSFKPSPTISSITELPLEIRSQLQSEEDLDKNVLIQRNSNVIFKHISTGLANQGVIFTDLETALQEHEELVRSYFMKAVSVEENQFTALHTALWNGGVFLYVPKNVKIEVPIQALFLTDDISASFLPHILIVAEANSSVTYVDYYVSGGDSGGTLVHNGIVEIFVKQGAHVQFASVHNLGESITDLSYRRSVIGNNGQMEWIIGEMNHGNSMSDTTSILQGSGSTTDAKVICVGTNEQKLNITTKAVHVGRSSSSDMSTRAVMRDSSTAIINGVTKIEKGAVNANGQQTEKVLMLSPDARGD
ncbi:MAG TPA: SufD family Fe-S cluster assembly protein, partial [Bacilli bacterium]